MFLWYDLKIIIKFLIIIKGIKMSIIVNLDIMLAKRKIKSKELSELIGITEQNLSVLKTNKSKAIRFSTLESICKVLDCQPGDLLSYTNNKDTSCYNNSDLEDSGIVVLG